VNIFDVTTNLTIDLDDEHTLHSIWPFGRYPGAQRFTVQRVWMPDPNGLSAPQINVTLDSVLMDVDWVEKWNRGLEVSVTLARAEQQALGQEVDGDAIYHFSTADCRRAFERVKGVFYDEIERLADPKLTLSLRDLVGSALIAFVGALHDAKMHELGLTGLWPEIATHRTEKPDPESPGS